jgi:hypothetical protein
LINYKVASLLSDLSIVAGQSELSMTLHCPISKKEGAHFEETTIKAEVCTGAAHFLGK